MAQPQPTQEQLDKWVATRDKGPVRFILIYGVLGWGLTTALLFSVISSFIGPRTFSEILGLAMIIFPLGGVAWGWMMWWLSERNWRRYQAEMETLDERNG